MQLSDILVRRGLVTELDIEAAEELERQQGGQLGDNLVAIGAITPEDLQSAVNAPPLVPNSIEETGISPRNLLNLLLKFMLLEASETVLDLSEELRLPRAIVQQLLDEAAQQRLIEAKGAVGSLQLSVRYALSEMGRAAAREALEQNAYIGPAPVALVDWQDQVNAQRIANEKLDADALRGAFAGLVVPEHYIRKMLPAISAGRSVLMFGPPGNGKTTLATRVATLFKEVVYIPYAVEVAGQLIKVFDPALHKPTPSPEPRAWQGSGLGLQREGYDQRFVACQRPVATAGGEMTLEMLDLQYNPVTKFYDAPLHVKALNGMLLIDDFGRQKFSPNDLLNRWIVPMENQIDFLKLNTGAQFSLPFDVLLIFSTNLQPDDLMDAAFLRRIQYKIKLFAPTVAEYRQIFDAVAKARGLTIDDEVFAYIVAELNAHGKYGLAYYQPRFVCDQVVEACKCFNLPPVLTKELAAEALSNLYFDIADTADAAA